MKALIAFLTAVAALLSQLLRRRSGVRLLVTVDRPEEKPRMTTNLTDTQRTTMHIEPVDRRGRPAPVDGAPKWVASPDTACMLEPSDDGLSCRVTPNGAGTFSVTATADALIGDGVENVTVTEFFSVSTARAAALRVTVDAPEEVPDDQPAPGPTPAPVVPPEPTGEPPAEPQPV